MDQTTIQNLVMKFSAPMAGYASTSPERRELAEMLVTHLWAALVAGPEMEEEVWQTLRTIGQLDDEAIQVIQQLYNDQMKPVVTNEQLAELRRRYRLNRNEQA